MKAEYIVKKDLILNKLEDLGIGVNYKPDSAFYIFCNMESFCQDSLELSLDMLQKVNLAVAPGKDFGPNYNQYIRLSYASSITNLRKGLKKLKKYICEYT